MAGSGTVKSITDNITSTLSALGIRFAVKSGVPDSSSSGRLPVGRVFYRGEDFQYSHGERAGYATARYEVEVILRGRDHTLGVRDQQGWIHDIRDALTVAALNIGDLALTKLVSRVEVGSARTEEQGERVGITLDLSVRYRES